MKRYGIILVVLLVFITLGLIGCEKKAEAPKSTPQPVAAPAPSEPAPAAAPAPAPQPEKAPEKPAKK